MNRTKNRLFQPRADYLLAIVRRPARWTPKSFGDVPPILDIVSQDYVASFEEASEDLFRCNKLAMRYNLDEWAVILHTGSDI